MKDKQKSFIVMRADSVSYASIAKELGISKVTAIEWGKLYKDVIDSLRFDTMQELKRTYSNSKVSQYETLLKHLQKIDNSIDGADYSKATVKDLFMIRNDITLQLEQIEKRTRVATDIKEDEISLDNLDTYKISLIE